MTELTVAVLATLDTKAQEATYVREQIERLGGKAILVDMGLVGEPGVTPDVTREEVVVEGGGFLATLLENPSRQEAAPVLIQGATRILEGKREAGDIHAVLALGGTQGTSNACAIMQHMPYGFPKIMVSTVASGDTSSFVGIKDITMMFSVGDILGLNPITRRILANAAGAAVGMARAEAQLEIETSDKPVVGITNLGVLTDGAMKAIQRFEDAGFETIVFHAVGSGGRAMEQMMREGLIGAVFDYALGEISDEVFGGLRAGGADRLTVAGKLGLPQVICPGGAEHLGIFTEADVVPDEYQGHQHTFHNPIIFVPRLNDEEMKKLAADIGERLQHTQGRAAFYLPLRGTSRYGVEGGELRNPDNDRVFFDALKAALPESIQVVEVDAGAEDDAFVNAAVDRLIELVGQ